MTKVSRSFLVLLLAAGLSQVAFAQTPERLGRLYLETAHGLTAPVPLDAGWVRTGGEPARLELAIGRVLRVAEHSAIHLRSLSRDEVEVVVAGGSVEARDPRGRPLGAGQNSTFVLQPNAGAPDALWDEALAGEGEAGADETSDDRRTIAPRVRPLPSLARED